MQRVETDARSSEREAQARAAGDSEWPAAWPEGLDYVRVNGASAIDASSGPFMPVLLESASPSVRFVYACFRLGVARSVAGLREATGLPARTVRHAVRWLVDRGLVERIPDLGDARRVQLRSPPRGTAMEASAVFVFS